MSRTHVQTRDAELLGLVIRNLGVLHRLVVLSLLCALDGHFDPCLLILHHLLNLFRRRFAQDIGWAGLLQRARVVNGLSD